MCWSTPPMRTRDFITACRDWLERQRARPDAWYTTWATLYEFRRVTTHARVMRRPWSASAAWNFVAALLASAGLAVLVPTGRHADVAEGGHFGAAASCRQSAPRRAHRHSYA